jgi:hypothetical protein
LGRVKARSSLLAAVAVLYGTLALGAPMASAESVGEKIVEKCGHEEPIGGYTQRQYEEALKDMATATREYSSCESEIRNAELAAAGGGGGGGLGGQGTSRVALPLTSAEQKAVQVAHKHVPAAVRVGSEPIRPGVVKASIASAVNTLPHPLFALLALLVAAALALVGREVQKRVRASRHG